MSKFKLFGNKRDKIDAPEFKSRKHEKKESKTLNLIRVLSYIIFCTAVLILILLFFIYKDSMSLDSFRRFFSYIDIETDENGIASAYEYERSEDNLFEYYESGFAVLNRQRLTVKSTDNKHLFTKQIDFEKPLLLTSKKLVLAYNQGSRDMVVVSNYNLAFEGKADGEIITCAMNSDGYYAVATLQDGKKAVVSVYNQNLIKVYEWVSHERYVTDIALTEDYLAVTSVSAQNIDFSSAVTVFKLDSADVHGIYEFNESVPINVCFTDDNKLLVLTDNKLIVLNDECKLRGEYDFGGLYLSDYDFGGNGYITLKLDLRSVGNESKLVTVDLYGNEIASLALNDEIRDIDVKGNYVGVLYYTDVIVYDRNFNIRHQCTSELDIDTLISIGDGSILLLGKDHAYYYIP